MQTNAERSAELRPTVVC